MAEIKCPQCGTVISLEQSDLDSVVRQVRDEEFRREVDERMRLLETERDQAVQLALQKAKAAETERLAAEKLTTQDGTASTVQRVHVTGSTVEELLQNIQNVDWSRVPVQEQPVHGGRFDFTV